MRANSDWIVLDTNIPSVSGFIYPFFLVKIPILTIAYYKSSSSSQ